MSEPRKNHLSIDGGQVKDDEHVASYKPIPESDTAEPVEYLETEEVYMQMNQNEIMETDTGDDLDDHWEHNSIKILLNSYLQNVERFRLPQVKKKNVWVDIANAVGKAPDSCDKKFRNLKQTFIRLLKKRNRNEIVFVKWPYFETFEKIYNVNGEYLTEIQQRKPETTTDNEETQQMSEFRSSKVNLSKSKEKLSPDGAEEKLLPKEEEAKIVTRVDMADAKYVVEDHRNGDAKIELDANKRQFSGLTKEELLRYSEDPFWVNLRWAMFILFWALWLCMLAGAITIIIRAPKCAPPEPKTWFEKGPLVDMEEASYADIEADLPLLKSSKVQGIFVDVPTYDIYDQPTAKESFEAFVKKAKEYGIKVIVDLIPNYVSLDHLWFQQSENKTGGYDDYFVWAEGKEFDESGKRKPPNNWVSTLNTSAWTWSDKREAHYLHQYGETQPDLNFNNDNVVKEFDNVLRLWMKAGAAGVRLNKARQLLVNATLADEVAATGRGLAPASDHTHYLYWRHRHTSDQPKLDTLLTRWAQLVDDASDAPGTRNTVFTIAEESRPELFLLQRNLTSLRPLETAPLSVDEDVTAAATEISKRLGKWPAMQLKTSPDAEIELASLALLLPAVPILELHQLENEDNDTATNQLFSHLAALREDASVQHGDYAVSAVPARDSELNTLLAVARWKPGHTGYLAVFNPSAEESRANLTSLKYVPHTLTPHHMSHAVRVYTNYTNNYAETADNVLVPPKSTIVLSYVPNTSSES